MKVEVAARLPDVDRLGELLDGITLDNDTDSQEIPELGNHHPDSSENEKDEITGLVEGLGNLYVLDGLTSLRSKTKAATEDKEEDEEDKESQKVCKRGPTKGNRTFNSWAPYNSGRQRSSTQTQLFCAGGSVLFTPESLETNQWMIAQIQDPLIPDFSQLLDTGNDLFPNAGNQSAPVNSGALLQEDDVPHDIIDSMINDCELSFDLPVLPITDGFLDVLDPHRNSYSDGNNIFEIVDLESENVNTGNGNTVLANADDPFSPGSDAGYVSDSQYHTSCSNSPSLSDVMGSPLSSISSSPPMSCTPTSPPISCTPSPPPVYSTPTLAPISSAPYSTPTPPPIYNIPTPPPVLTPAPPPLSCTPTPPISSTPTPPPPASASRTKRNKYLNGLDDKECDKWRRAILRKANEKESNGLSRKDEKNRTMLHLAILQRQDVYALVLLNMLQKSFQNGSGTPPSFSDLPSYLNQVDDFGRTPLQLACMYNFPRLVEYLLELGASPVLHEKFSGGTVLHYVCERGSRFLNVAKIICSQASECLNMPNSINVTPLHVAVGYHGMRHQDGGTGTTDIVDNTAMIELLLDKNAKLCVQDKIGRTPLHWMIITKNLDLLEIMYSKACDWREAINMQNIEGKTVLHCAAQNMELELDEQVDLVHKLLTRYSDTLIQDKSGKFPKDLVCEARRKHLQILGEYFSEDKGWQAGTGLPGIPE